MRRNSFVLETRNVADVKSFDGSAHVHNRAQRGKLAASVRRFGQVKPILVDTSGTVIDGQALLETLIELGKTEVEVLVVQDLNDDEIRALRLALNRIPEDATWNPAKLRTEIEHLISINFDMTVTGFEQTEIDMSLSINEPGSGAVEDAPPAVDPTASAVTQRGYMWSLGKHRLICGDSRDTEIVDQLTGGDEVQMCFTDPPYNVAISSVSGFGRHKHREFEMGSGEWTPDEFIVFLVAFLTSTISVLKDGGLIYVCMDWKHQRELLTAAHNLSLKLMNLCVWTKGPGMGSFYRNAHELVHIFKKGSAPHINNFLLGKQGRSRSNVWPYRGMNVPSAERNALLGVHPTIKPVAMVADAIKDVTHRNAVILDPFIGSGTTIIAAETTGRRCYGIELDPLYVDAAVRRWQDHTGEQAVLFGTTTTFDELEKLRSPQLMLPPPSSFADEE